MKTIRFLIGGLVVLALLAAGAFTAARLFNREGQAGMPGIGPNFVGVDRAEELPETEPDVVGILVRRQDNSLYLGTGNVTFHRIREDDSQQPRFESGYDGPVVEVLVTRDTQVYFDVTRFDAPIKENGNVQQVVQPGSLEELGQDHLVQSWGERQGDRLLARMVVIYSPPG